MRNLIISIALLATFSYVGASQDPHGHGKSAEKQAESPAEKAFAQLKAMAGIWEGKDTSSGRNIRLEYRVIANGSTVMSISDYDAHPNDQMVTMFHLDKGKLLLTHYCVARNQPRLEATKISDDGKAVEFKFKDGTGMKDVNTGHMHSVKMWFLGPNDYKDQWSFYQNGKETFMEDFVLKRVK